MAPPYLDPTTLITQTNNYKTQILTNMTDLQTQFTTFNNSLTGPAFTSCSTCAQLIRDIQNNISLLTTEIDIPLTNSTLTADIATLRSQLPLATSPTLEYNSAADTLKQNFIQMYNSQYFINMELFVGILILCFAITQLFLLKTIDFTNFFQSYIYGSSTNRRTNK